MTGGRFILATRSSAKTRDLLPVLRGAGFDVVDLTDAGVAWSPAEEGIEAFDTFAANALAKARYFSELTGLPAFADDSGLVVPVLGGMPGVRSSRWSRRPELAGAELDAANNARLISELDACGGWPRPSAIFVCAAAYSDAGLSCARAAEAHGRLVREPRGSGGFGYDPHFVSDELGVTFAETGSEAKARVSHRTRAFTELLRSLGSLRAGARGC